MGKLGIFIDKTRGEARLAVKQGKPQKPKDTRYQQKLIDICLCCEQKVCRGCPNDKRFKKQRRLNDNELLF